MKLRENFLAHFSLINKRNPTAYLLVIFALLCMVTLSVQAIVLYVDPKTGQVYTTPSKDRVKLGEFKQIDGKDSEGVVDSQQALETKIDRKMEELRAMEARIEHQQKELAEQKNTQAVATASPAKAEEKKWYNRIGIRGYTQLRYNTTLSGDKDGVSFWPDRSVGPDGSFLIRRARLIIFGDITDHLSLYIQPDFASTPTGSSTSNFAQLRDAYGDIFFDKNKEFRIRVGQSKIPYSFENLQSSQNRLALDRNDALNSCCRDERDLGAFFYWTPTFVRDQYKELSAKNLKGSGDYGMFAFGVYNGQGANRIELNEQVHMVSRLTYPHKFENGQILEAGVQAIHGRFVPSTGPNASGVTPTRNSPNKGFRDQRMGLHAVLYPQPFGLQGEWNWGRGPELNESQTGINNASLNGGYIQAMYKIDGDRWGTFFPFVKWQKFDGALKFERNAPQNRVRDLELGLEWQILPELEIVATYAMMNRTNVRNAPFDQFKADILRFQLQWNYF